MTVIRTPWVRWLLIGTIVFLLGVAAALAVSPPVVFECPPGLFGGGVA
jgi:hypothetical protein